MAKPLSWTVAILSPKILTESLLIFIFLVWVKRVFWMIGFRKTNPPLLPEATQDSTSPKISVIVPARDEEKNISNCLEYLAKQTYPNFEIISVDDRSTDKTPDLLKNFQKNTAVSFKTVRIEKLPPRWTGKNYAMFTGSKAATGQWLLFTDADTTHKPESLQTAIFQAREKKNRFFDTDPRNYN